MIESRSEQELVRLQKLQKLKETAYPYPNDVSVTLTAIEAINLAKQKSEDGQKHQYCLAGRLMSLRLMGKAAFCHLQDRSGKIQIYLRLDDIGAEAFASFKKFDLGDIVEIYGYPFITKTGEPSLHVTKIRLLVKCLQPLPEKWHGLSDVEQRYRKRYVDLMVSPEGRETFIKRSRIISAIRRFFDDRDYIEVETPIMSSVASGASARPFVTHHNSLDLNLFLRIAPELPLKRLVIGGLERVYELGRVFRNEGISTEHNPEFTMLEFYQAYATYETLMELTEELITGLCLGINGSTEVLFNSKMIDFSRPWKRLSMVESIYELGQVPREINLNTIEGAKDCARFFGDEDLVDLDDYGKIIFDIFDRHLQERIVNPTFITHHPLSISPLARPSADDPRFVDRFELMVAGMELANAFSELNDSEDQRCRFEEQVRARERGDEEAMGMDEDFVRALEYGLPPTAGEGIGIDRLVMLLTGQTSIRDVILFPQMRPEKQE